MSDYGDYDEVVSGLSACNLSGLWISQDMAEWLIEYTRGALQSYSSFTDAEILVALDIKGCEPSTAAQFLEGFISEAKLEPLEFFCPGC